MSGDKGIVDIVAMSKNAMNGGTVTIATHGDLIKLFDFMLDQNLIRVNVDTDVEALLSGGGLTYSEMLASVVTIYFSNNPEDNQIIVK